MPVENPPMAWAVRRAVPQTKVSSAARAVAVVAAAVGLAVVAPADRQAAKQVAVLPTRRAAPKRGAVPRARAAARARRAAARAAQAVRVGRVGGGGVRRGGGVPAGRAAAGRVAVPQVLWAGAKPGVGLQARWAARRAVADPTGWAAPGAVPQAQAVPAEATIQTLALPAAVAAAVRVR